MNRATGVPQPKHRGASSRLSPADQADLDGRIARRGYNRTANDLAVVPTTLHKLEHGGTATAALVERVSARLAELRALEAAKGET